MHRIALAWASRCARRPCSASTMSRGRSSNFSVACEPALPPSADGAALGLGHDGGALKARLTPMLRRWLAALLAARLSPPQRWSCKAPTPEPLAFPCRQELALAGLAALLKMLPEGSY